MGNRVEIDEEEDDDDEDDEEGEEDLDEDDSDESEDLMEGNEDLSSHREQSFCDQDMLADQLEDEDGGGEFDDDSYGSDYGDEDSSAWIDVSPAAAIQSMVPVKSSGPAGFDNEYNDIVFSNQI